jgi:uncharacterized protein (TIGR00730 family)
MGARPEFAQAAVALADCLLANGQHLVYGGAHVGLMGLIADRLLAQGGEVTGVIPQQLVDKEIAHTRLTQIHVVRTMHERKALMADLSDAFIALPGAYGTLDELFEIITWAQLGIHSKPIGLLNVLGYFDPLLQFLDGCVTGGFLKPANRELFLVETDPQRLMERMSVHSVKPAEKWIGREAR